MRKFLAGLIFLISISSFAQEIGSQESLITDRPDATEAPNLLQKGSFQIETGVFYKDLGSASLSEELFGYNTTLLRYGLLENLELRLGWDLVNTKSKIFDYENTGFEPLLLGVKIGIAEENGAFPQIGFIGHLNLPFTVSKDVRPENTGVDFRFAFSHQLSEKSNLSYNVGAEWGNDSPEAAYIYTIAYGYSITQKFGVYAELYGDFPENNLANHNWDAGLTYLVNKDLQLDALIGTGIENDLQLMVGAGISYRISKD